MASVGRGRDPAEVSRSFELNTHDDQVEVLVAELVSDVPVEDGVSEPLGHAVVRFEDPGPAQHRVAAIEELYVTPRARNVGLGSALLDHAKISAAARGCTGLDAVALPGDRATKNFFEDHAMVARAIIVHSEIEPHTQGTADPGS
jgi:GNAT superfamily N-acetyltransferase